MGNKLLNGKAIGLLDCCKIGYTEIGKGALLSHFVVFERFFVRHVKALKIVNVKRTPKTATLVTVKSAIAE